MTQRAHQIQLTEQDIFESMFLGLSVLCSDERRVVCCPARIVERDGMCPSHPSSMLQNTGLNYF